MNGDPRDPFDPNRIVMYGAPPSRTSPRVPGVPNVPIVPAASPFFVPALKPCPVCSRHIRDEPCPFCYADAVAKAPDRKGLEEAEALLAEAAKQLQNIGLSNIAARLPIIESRIAVATKLIRAALGKETP